MRHRSLRALIPELASTKISERSKLKGVSESRASQILAGAIVAEAAMSAFVVKTLHVSPWVLREGILLQRLDALRGSASMRATRLLEEATQAIGTNAATGWTMREAAPQASAVSDGRAPVR